MSRCLVCGGSDRLGRRLVTARWNDERSADVGACLGLVGARLIGELYLAAVATRFQLDLPVCAGCRRREQLVQVLGGALNLAAAIGLPLLGLMLGARLSGFDPVWILRGLVGGALAFAAVFTAWTLCVARRTRIELVDADGAALTLRMPRAAVVDDVLSEYAAARGSIHLEREP